MSQGIKLEDTRITLLVGIIISRTSGDHQLAVLFRNDCGSGSETRGVWADQKVSVVFGDEACVKFLHAFFVDSSS